MKIHLLSDLHLEFGAYAPSCIDADIVVLAGDIHTPSRGDPARAVTWARQNFSIPVVMVAGNHEHWGSNLSRTTRHLRAASGGAIHFLENESVVIGGVRFVGATMWTDYALMGVDRVPVAQGAARESMNDFRSIRDDRYRRVHPDQLLALHAETRAFLEHTLAESFDGPTVVVTHHAPSALGLPERNRASGDILNAAYASNMEDLMGGGRVDAWLFGHVHSSIDGVVSGTRLVSNPRGYAPKHMNPSFDPGLVINV